MAKIVIKYPPDYDGELHIEHEERVDYSVKNHDFKFTYSHEGTAWEALVKAARDIIAQDNRRKSIP